MSKYQMAEFAALAGVTIKSLRHYERLGLLKPERTAAGYRCYSGSDLERLEQIVALKFLGLPLKRIKALLDGAPIELADALRLQREAIEGKQRHLERAVQAIRAAEESLAPEALSRIIEVMKMHNDIDAMQQFYGTRESWEQRRQYYEEGPAPEWRELYREIAEVWDDDPSTERAQALADRWLELSVRAASGETALQTDSPTAWMHRDRWPPTMQRRAEEFQLPRANDFIRRAAQCSRKKYFSEEAWARYVELRNRPAEDASRWWQTRVDLFRDVEAALGEDPAGETGQALAARWNALMEAASGGDAGVKAGLENAWADRGNWPATLRWLEEGLAALTGERFQNAARFLDLARQAIPTATAPAAPIHSTDTPR